MARPRRSRPSDRSANDRRVRRRDRSPRGSTPTPRPSRGRSRACLRRATDPWDRNGCSSGKRAAAAGPPGLHRRHRTPPAGVNGCTPQAPPQVLSQGWPARETEGPSQNALGTSQRDRIVRNRRIVGVDQAERRRIAVGRPAAESLGAATQPAEIGMVRQLPSGRRSVGDSRHRSLLRESRGPLHRAKTKKVSTSRTGALPGGLSPVRGPEAP